MLRSIRRQAGKKHIEVKRERHRDIRRHVGKKQIKRKRETEEQAQLVPFKGLMKLV